MRINVKNIMIFISKYVLWNQLNIYLDAFEYLRKEINNKYNQIKEKMQYFEKIFTKKSVLILMI